MFIRKKVWLDFLRERDALFVRVSRQKADIELNERGLKLAFDRNNELHTQLEFEKSLRSRATEERRQDAVDSLGALSVLKNPTQELGERLIGETDHVKKRKIREQIIKLIDMGFNRDDSFENIVPSVHAFYVIKDIVK